MQKDNKGFSEITEIIELNRRMAHVEAELERKRRPVSIMPENGKVPTKMIIALTTAIAALAAVIIALVNYLPGL